MSIKEHLVALGRVTHQEEGPAGTELQMRHLHLVKHATDQHAFLAPVKLERFAMRKGQGNKGSTIPPLRFTRGTDKVRHPTVAPLVALRLDLVKQGSGGSPGVLVPQAIGFECRHQDRLKGLELGILGLSLVLRLHIARRPQPLLDRVARQTRALGNLTDR